MMTINKTVRILILGCAFLGLSQVSSAQSIQLKATYYGDKFVNKGDTVEMVLINGRGDYQWQQSYDQENWENIDGANAASISTRIDSTVWFRVRMDEENCDPAFSEIGSVVPMLISEETVVLDSESLVINSDSVELSQGIYRMSTSQDIDPQPGEILVGQNDKGFIRKIESATKNGDEWVVTTTQGTLEDVIDEISLSDSLVIEINGGGMKTADVNGQEVPVKLTYAAPGLNLKSGSGSISLGSMVLVDEDTEEGHVYAAIETGLIIFNPVFRRRLDVRMNNGLEYFLFSVSGEMDITADISLESNGAANPQIDPINLFTAEIGPVMIGPVATYISIDFVLNSEIVTGGTGTFSIGYESSFITDYGASYYHLHNPRWTAIWEKTNESVVTPPEFELESTASLNIDINPVLNMEIAGVQTAYLSLNNYLKGEGSSGTEGWTTTAHAGTGSSVVYDVDVIGYDVVPAQFENSPEEWLIYEASGIEGAPVVSTFSAEKVERDSYILKGRIDDDQGTQISRVGFCWGTEPAPDFEDKTIELASVEYSFDHLLENLSLYQTIYFRAFAENPAGVGWGGDQEFSTVVEPPTVQTTPPYNIMALSAWAGGVVLDDGGAEVTERGICWDANGDPDLSDTVIVVGSGTGSFECKIEALYCANTFFARAYAINSAGVSYGEVKQFGCKDHDGIFIDPRDGRGYYWITYGEQDWMINNLGYLPAVSPPSAGSKDSPHYYVYDYDGDRVEDAKLSDNWDHYHALYNWTAAMDACPDGWHLPKRTEWTQLYDYLKEKDIYGFDNDRRKIAKSLASKTGWSNSNYVGTPGYNLGNNNTSGFEARPGGYRQPSLFPTQTLFVMRSRRASFWTSLHTAGPDGGAATAVVSFDDDSEMGISRSKDHAVSVRCIRGVTLPVVSTNEVSSIEGTSAECGGRLISSGGGDVTSRGVCWTGSGSLPSLDDSFTIDGSGFGDFISSITGLSPEATYRVRAYATNNVGTSYGEDFYFTTESGGGGGDGTFTDSRDGNVYEYKHYGNQTWMMENLAYLPSVTPSSAGALEDPYYYVYGYEGSDVGSAKQANSYSNFGVLYNHESTKTACPSGWHVPIHEEWTELENYLISNGFGFGGSGDDIGKSMATTSGWVEHVDAGNIGNDQSSNNSSSFNAPAGGYRSGNGGFGGSEYNATYWTSSPYESTRMWTRLFNYSGSNMYQNDYGSQNGFSIRCIQGSKPNTIPMVYTEEVTGVTENSAQSGGTVLEDGGTGLTARGVCWNTSGNPDISDNKTIDGSGIGSFTSVMTGLSDYTTYYVRAYATNSVGTAYGYQKQFTTEDGGDGEVGTFSDSRDGRSYSYKRYGSQTWMTENLAYLPEVYSSAGGSDGSRYYYVYGYEGEDVTAAKAEANYSTYGALYNWDAASYECPAGWHLPSSSDYQDLLNYLTDNGYGYEGSGNDVAKALASVSGWISTDNPGEVGNNPGENNSSGFSALPTGYRYSQGGFLYQGDRTFFWTSDTDGTSSGVMIIKNWHTTPGIGTAIKPYGFPVRCLKD